MRIINRRPGRGLSIFLAAMPFVVLIAAYLFGSHLRLSENPNDKILPSLVQMGDAIYEYAFVPEKRSGDLVLLSDTLISLWRLGTAMVIAVSIALAVGLPMGLIPWIRELLSPFIAVISLIPPITVLPILFIIVGLDEASKIALIVVGTLPIMARAVALAVEDIPREMLIKAQTLGASTWQLTLRVVLPQVLPQLIVATRFALVPAWIFLISAEAIAATGGLGYRIFLVRRFLAMDVILPYVAWITLLAWAMDYGLARLQRRAFPWFTLEKGS